MMNKKRTIGLILILMVFLSGYYFLNLSNNQDNKSLKYAHTTALVDAPSMIAGSTLKKNGIIAVPFSTGRETTQALLGGSAFAATLAEWPFLLASDKRDDLRIIAVITSAQSMGIIANSKTGIDSIVHLKDKRVGFPQGTTAQYVFESLAKENGVLGDIKTVNLPPPNLQPSLIRGDIDAMVVWQPFLERVRLEQPEDFIYLPGSQEYFRVVYCVVSTKENIENNPEGIKRIIEALLEAEEKINQGSEETLGILSKEVGLDIKTLKSLLPLFRFEVVLDDEIIETLEKLAFWADESGLITSPDILTRDWKKFIHVETLKELRPDRIRFEEK